MSFSTQNALVHELHVDSTDYRVYNDDGGNLLFEDPTNGVVSLNDILNSYDSNLSGGDGITYNNDRIDHDPASVHEDGGALEIAHDNLQLDYNDHHGVGTGINWDGANDIAHDPPSVHEAGGSLAISHNNLTINYNDHHSVGSGIQWDGNNDIAHANTSSISSSISVNNGDTIDVITFDTYGHVETLSTQNINHGNIANVLYNQHHGVGTGIIWDGNNDIAVDQTWLDSNYATSDTNYYLDGASFDTGNGVLSLSVNGASDQSVDLDGRYATSDTNYYLSGVSFDTGNGVLSLTVNGASNQSVDLDGRYATSDTNYYLSGVSESNGSFTFSMSGISGYSVDITDTSLNFGSYNLYANDFVLTSDLRLKKNISEIEDKGIDDVSIFSFQTIEDETQRTKYGVGAQHLEVNYPELVYQTDDGYKKISGINFLMAKMKKKDDQIHELTNRLDEKDKQIENLTKRLEALEEKML